MNFELDEFRGRIDRTRDAMLAADLELLIVCDPSNRSWLTGYDGWSFLCRSVRGAGSGR